MKKKQKPKWLKRLKGILYVKPRNKKELVSLLRDAQIRGLIDVETLSMIEGVIIFSQLRVRDIMLPKSQMISIEEKSKLSDIIKIVTESRHSRFPVLDEKKDVIGILHAKDLIRIDPSEEDFDIIDLVRQTSFVPESKHLNAMLRDFRNNRNHMAIIVDEYGDVSGFVTLEDIIEQIVGEIEDEFDIDEESYIKMHNKNQYIIKGYTPVEEFNEILQTNFSDEIYDTIGGILLANFGYLPERGETIVINNFEFKIINADARRIKLVECFDLRGNGKQ